MEPIFRQEYEITAFHLDCFGRTKPSVLLHFAQEAAGADFVKLQQLQAELTDLEEKLEHKTERWMYLTELAEKIEAQKK